ncbi:MULTISPECIES: hypothetical protein [unclassified Streptomyces]|uniref:hypothetical protein n=1 Tax=unclassified Streptomyces TaxID=2593676 RepID=UPI000DB8FD03|nr:MULTISPECIES: hypothetical protein [unclassified Streptomyces]MYT69200.1 hypothetical protein [Streptomyces sp. SID8367]RAJ82715.1 hypothetical protein K377_04436 [Streptomyces sp. PsTaAH-137]
MTRTRIAVLGGALALATTLTGVGWCGYQQWTAPSTSPEALTTYDPDDAREVTSIADDVFTATVLSSEAPRRINELDWAIYRVRVSAPHKGALHGTLDVALPSGSTELPNGHAYVFATFTFHDARDIHGQVTDTTPQPATHPTVHMWHQAAAR